MKPPKDSDSVPDKTQLTDLQRQVDLLQRNIRRLQLEHDLLKKANELLKKGLGVAPQLLSNREKTLLVDALKHTYTLVELFAELDLARSSYFYHCSELRRADKYADARVAITDEFENRPVIHSDRGAHYRWPGWLSRMHKAKLIRSMSRKGCSPDNAACEGFFGRLKTELFYPRNWQETTIEEFIQIVDSYIHWYNEKRIKVSLGSLSPLEYRASLGIAA